MFVHAQLIKVEVIFLLKSKTDLHRFFSLTADIVFFSANAINTEITALHLRTVTFGDVLFYGGIMQNRIKTKRV